MWHNSVIPKRGKLFTQNTFAGFKPWFFKGRNKSPCQSTLLLHRRRCIRLVANPGPHIAPGPVLLPLNNADIFLTRCSCLNYLNHFNEYTWTFLQTVEWQSREEGHWKPPVTWNHRTGPKSCHFCQITQLRGVAGWPWLDTRCPQQAALSSPSSTGPDRENTTKGSI